MITIRKQRNFREASLQWYDVMIGDLVKVHIRDRVFIGVRTRLRPGSCGSCLFGRKNSGYKHCCWFSGHRCRCTVEAEEELT